MQKNNEILLNRNAHTYKFKDVAFFGYILVVIQFLFFAYFFPNIDYPDASFQLQRVFSQNNESFNLYFELLKIYRSIMSVLLNNRLVVELINTGPIKYFSMDNHMMYEMGNFLSISILQIFNLIMILSSMFLYNYSVLRDKKIDHKEKNFFLKINVLYYVYPAIAYLVMGITSDFFIYLFQPFFIYFIYTKRNYSNILIMALLFILVDESVASNALLFIIYICNKYILNKSKKNLKFKIILFNLLFPIAAFYLGTVLINVFQYNIELLETAKYVQENYGNIPTKIINFMFSSFSLWGVGNYITFPLFYIGYFIVLIIIVKRALSINLIKNEEIVVLLFSVIATIGATILMYPPYSHIRFFSFYVLVLLIGFHTYIRKDKYIQNNKDFYFVGIGLFFHNLILIMFYSIKIFILK